MFLPSLLLQNVPPDFVKFTWFYILYVYFVFPPTFTMMHLCITQCTYWTPLYKINVLYIITPIDAGKNYHNS